MSADEFPAPLKPAPASADSSASEQEPRRPLRPPQYGYFDEDRKHAVYGWYDTREQVETPCESAEQFHAQDFASIPGKPVTPGAGASEQEFRPVRSATRTSASMTTRAGRSELRPANPPAQPSDQNDKKPISNPPTRRKTYPPVAVEPAPPPVAGRELPEIAGIQYERKNDGSIEAWHTPEAGKRNRAGKVYLGRIGKRLLTAWSKLSPDDARAAVVAWIAEKRAAKRIG